MNNFYLLKTDNEALIITSNIFDIAKSVNVIKPLALI